MQDPIPPHFSPPKEIFATRRFRVLETRVDKRVGGGSYDYTFIRPMDGVVVLPVLDDGRVVLIRNWRLPVGKALWELPAGVVEAGEDPAQAARREVEEETGYRSKWLESLPSLRTSPGLTTERQAVFLASGLEFVGQKLDEGEHLRVQAMTRDEVLELARTGGIEDARCLAVVLWWAQFGA
jgi:ADP-ribose pyrophosphatase